tara:strand:+ start:2104 stop:2490 length:387 start_codon:yes stop_codon:yes gene_type:complete
MPEVKNEKGEVIANMPYNQAGQQQAQAMVAENPGYTINDASQRNVQTYAGGGKTGYNVPMYKDGGSVPKGRKRRSPHMSEATHPGVDKVRNEMIKNEADVKKQPRAVYKMKQQVLRDKLKRIKHKGDK